MQFSHVDTALLLAGGRGTRLGPLTKNVPKPLLEVAGRPFICWQIKSLNEQGINNIIISVQYLADQFKEIAEQSSGNIKLIREPDPLGTGGAIIYALKHLPKKFLVLNADTFCPLPLKTFLDCTRSGWLGGIAAGEDETFWSSGFQHSTFKENRRNWVYQLEHMYLIESFQTLGEYSPSSHRKNAKRADLEALAYKCHFNIGRIKALIIRYTILA